MNNIIYPMKVHAVKLEYRRLLLKAMPHGYFRIIKGIKNVVISFDPENSKCTPNHPRTLRVSSKLGKKYSEIILNYQKIKSEYEDLLNSWLSTYSFAPPRV